MATLTIIVLISLFAFTGNLLVSASVAVGFFVLVVPVMFFLAKWGVPLWVRLVVQVLTAGVVLLGCRAITNTHGELQVSMGDGMFIKVNEPAEENNGDAAKELHEQIEPPTTPQSKDDKVRDFVLREAPDVWQTYTQIGQAADELTQRANKLKQTLEEFAVNPQGDADYNLLIDKRNALLATRATLKIKMEKAYIESRKYAAMPSKKSSETIRRKVLEDGIEEAEAAKAKFEELRRLK